MVRVSIQSKFIVIEQAIPTQDIVSRASSPRDYSRQYCTELTSENLHPVHYFLTESLALKISHHGLNGLVDVQAGP